MRRDTIKTLAGLLIIGVIVVATFLYGNAQRQAQLRNEQDKQKQSQEEQANKAAPSASVSPGQSPAPSNTQTATAPVQSPAASSIQGVGSSGGQVAGTQSTPAAGASGGEGPADLPETGGPETAAIGIGAIVLAWVALRRSKRAVFLAARARR